MNQDDKALASNDSLDEAIRGALQVDADPRHLARLERYWLEQSQRRLRRRRALGAISLAAAALAAVAAIVVLRNREDGRQSALAVRSLAPLREDSEPADPSLADDPELADRSHSAGRAPTAYERFVFAARTSAPKSATSLSATIEDAIYQLTSDPNSDAKQVLDSSGLKRSDAELPLLRRLPRSAHAEQIAILRLLAGCGTPRSLPALLRLGRDEAIRDEVLATIEQIVGIEGLAQVVGTATDPELRSLLMLRLLTIDSEQALLGYLSLVRNGAMRPEALAVAEEAPQLPIARLLACLDHGDKAVRLSAAIVLGRVNGPEVTKLLITRVTEKPSDSTEAWMALLACRGEMAEEFLAYATRRPQLLGHFNSARVQWAQTVP